MSDAILSARKGFIQMKKRRTIIVCICILAAAAFTLALALPKKSYAAIGRNARKHYAEYETRHSDPQDEPAKDEDDDSSEFWFPVPEGYLNKKTDEKKYVSRRYSGAVGRT